MKMKKERKQENLQHVKSSAFTINRHDYAQQSECSEWGAVLTEKAVTCEQKALYTSYTR
jgi:hypothetical protein